MMSKGDPKRKFAFVVPTLGGLSAQSEDVVQLLLFAAARLEQESTAGTDEPFAATIISADRDTSGWKHLSSLFSEEARRHISVEDLEEPATPNLSIASHKPAYELYEFLKRRSFDEVHCLDRHGLAYYPTQAKRLGLRFLATNFVVHVVGGTIYRNEVEDKLLDDVGALMDDLLERGSLERADVICVHDRKAWEWYSGKIEVRGDARIHDLAWAEAMRGSASPTPAGINARSAIVYYGPLGPGGGLPLFCDAMDRALPGMGRPVEIFFVGSPHSMGGMDAVSYIRLRSEKWGVPVTIKREFSIADEINFVFECSGVVVCNTVRQEGLRQRLIAGSGLEVLHVRQPHASEQNRRNRICPPNPGRIAQALVEMLSVETVNRPQLSLRLADLWRAGRPLGTAPGEIVPSPPLQEPSGSGPRVSVCVTHYRRPEMLRKALDSLMRQTYKNFEVIVVDDGSPDPEIQSELAIIGREIEPLGWRLLVQENRYLGAARNYGASHATGDFLLFMDDDNIAKPGEISTLVAVALRSGAGIVTSFCDVFETDSPLEDNTPPKMRFTPFGSDPALGALSNCYGDANALYSHEVFRRLGGFTEDYGITHEDWELFCRASLEGVKIVCVPEPLFWYRVDNGGMFRGMRTQIHKSANLRRHIRPYLEKLPYYQAKLVQLAQGLTAELPFTTVGASTRAAGPRVLRTRQDWRPYARVAVIVRTKDRPILLRRAIRSVLDQTFKDWLLVIVNDGGNPENVELVTDAVADELAGRFLVLHNPVSLGMQTASNVGIGSCDSDFIIIHDDDDTWKPTFLARTVSHLDEFGWNPKLCGVITWSEVIVEELCEDGDVKMLSRFIFNDKLHTISLMDLAVENCFPPISFLFRRAALDIVGPFDQQPGPLGDWEFHLRVLRRYDIDVIPEPLANYHHRTQATVGVYGNTVHAQSDLHRSKRIELQNRVLRRELDGDHGLTFAQLLTFGELQKAIFEKQGKEFQRIHDSIRTIDQGVKSISLKTGTSSTVRRGANLVRNGDFRLWTGPDRTIKGPGGGYEFSPICPDFLICYDGLGASYRVERRKWTEDGRRLPFGKTYLHIEKDGHATGATFFNLECTIRSVLPLSGQTICVSGLCRMKGPRNWISVGGRYDLGDGRQMIWPDQMASLPIDWERWSCSIPCPSVQETELSRGHYSRILLKLPYELSFEFEVTDFQVEIGTTPTEFVSVETFSLRERLSMLRDRKRAWSSRVRKKP